MAIEALDIEIRHFSGTAATDIDALGQALLRLKKRVSNINAEELAARFEHLNAAIKQLDTENLERVAEAMKKIADAAGVASREVKKVSKAAGGAVSRDGGESWMRELDFVRGPGEYSYPAVISAGDRLLCTFTWRRERIMAAEVSV